MAAGGKAATGDGQRDDLLFPASLSRSVEDEGDASSSGEKMGRKKALTKGKVRGGQKTLLPLPSIQ